MLEVLKEDMNKFRIYENRIYENKNRIYENTNSGL